MLVASFYAIVELFNLNVHFNNTLIAISFLDMRKIIFLVGTS